MAQPNLLTSLYDKLVTGKEKAVIAFIAGTVVAYVAQSGLTVDQILTAKGLKALVAGVALHLFVYFTRNTAQYQDVTKVGR